MTIEEFNNTRFGAGMKAKYKGEVYTIGSVDFEEKLVGIYMPEDLETTWVRCENISIIE